MNTRPYLLHALSPLHAGTGHAADIIDLPTARMKATGIPFVPGSSLKGVLRDARRTAAPDDPKIEAVFGPASKPEEHAGALVVGDARLLALPVRSFRGTFAWTTSPLLLTLARRDLAGAPAVPRIEGRAARVPRGSGCLHEDRIFLEDLDLKATSSDDVTPWAQLLAPLVSTDDDIFTKRFAVVDDETMTFLWETATQVDARVRIDEHTRTVASGALWLEESLPPETLLIGLMAGDRSRKKEVPLRPDEVLDYALQHEQLIQLGGKATVGRGRCRMLPVGSESGRR
jgi:CRISPR-associated protein Cmr4